MSKRTGRILLGRRVQRGRDTILIGEGEDLVKVTVTMARNNKVTLAVSAPLGVRVDREEVRD